jgi:hypothetical protein
MTPVQVWMIVAASLLALACVEMYWQLRRGQSFWRALRTWFGKIVDILSA